MPFNQSHHPCLPQDYTVQKYLLSTDLSVLSSDWSKFYSSQSGTYRQVGELILHVSFSSDFLPKDGVLNKTSVGNNIIIIILSFDIAPFPYKHAQRRITFIVRG